MLLHVLADLTATETRPEAKATAQALRAAAETGFPRQPFSALSVGILATSALPSHPAIGLIRDAHL